MIHSAEGVLLDSAKRILVDSNILIAFFDTRHKLHDKVYSRLIPVYVAGAEFGSSPKVGAGKVSASHSMLLL